MPIRVRTLAAYVVFQTLALVGIFTILGHPLLSDRLNLILKPDACPSPPTYTSESQRRYTGLSPLDHAFCLGVEFVKVSLVPESRAFTSYFYVNLASPLLVLFLESSRQDGPSLFFAWALSAAAWSSAVGIWIPITWLFFFCFLSAPVRKPLDKGAAEGLLLSHVIAYLATVVPMIATSDSYAIALWGCYPTFATLIILGWSAIRPTTFESGHFVTQMALATCLISSAFIHITALFNYAPRFNLDDILNFLPSFSVPDPGLYSLTTERIIYQFLQWDAILSLGSTIIAAFFLVDWVEEYVLFALAAPMVLLAMGPGALICSLWMWREWKLTVLEGAARMVEQPKSKEE